MAMTTNSSMSVKPRLDIGVLLLHLVSSHARAPAMRRMGCRCKYFATACESTCIIQDNLMIRSLCALDSIRGPRQTEGRWRSFFLVSPALYG